jgi:hypothetical protein
MSKTKLEGKNTERMDKDAFNQKNFILFNPSKRNTNVLGEGRCV